MKPQQRVILYRNGLRGTDKKKRYFERTQALYAETDDHRACTGCGRYVKITKSGKLFNHRMGPGINDIPCLNPAS